MSDTNGSIAQYAGQLWKQEVPHEGEERTEMNANLKDAFSFVGRAREALNTIRQEKGFHDVTWEQAFTQTFDQMEGLKSASDRDAAILGKLFCQILHGLVNQLIEEPDNQLSLSALCIILFPGTLNDAERFFEYALSDLEESR